MTTEPIVVYLRDTVTGYERAYETEGLFEEGKFFDFIWDEGNYACDCNRSLFLWDWDDSKNLDCNVGENRIAVDKITRPNDDEILYSDEADP